MKTGYLGTAADGGDGDSLGENGDTPAPEEVAPHSPPWQWAPVPPDSDRGIVKANGERLVAADGREPIWGEIGIMRKSTGEMVPLPTGVACSTRFIRELIRAAPEMQDALRDVADGRVPSLDPDEEVVTVFISRGRFKKLMEILAALDAARASIADPVWTP